MGMREELRIIAGLEFHKLLLYEYEITGLFNIHPLSHRILIITAQMITLLL